MSSQLGIKRRFIDGRDDWRFQTEKAPVTTSADQFIQGQKLFNDPVTFYKDVICDGYYRGDGSLLTGIVPSTGGIMTGALTVPQLKFTNNTTQTTAYKSLPAGTYTNSNITVNALGQIAAIYNGSGGGGGGGGTATALEVFPSLEDNVWYNPTFVLGTGSNLTVYADAVTNVLRYNPSTSTLQCSTFVGNVTGDLTGTVTGNASSATQINVTTATGQPGHHILFANGISGLRNVEADNDLTYNSSTNTIAATYFSGALLGNATTATSAGSAATATTAGTATNVNLTNTYGNPNHHILFADATSGSQSVQAATGLTYNTNTGDVQATKFTGAFTGNLTGNADTATLANTATTAGTCTGNAASATTAATCTGNAATATTATNVTVSTTYPTSTNYVSFVNATTGDKPVLVKSNLTYDTTSNTLTSPAFSGALTGNASTASQVNISSTLSGSSQYLTVSPATTGNQQLSATTNLVYYTTTTTLSCPTFSGNLTGNVTGNLTGTATYATNVNTTVAPTNTYYLPLVNGATGGIKALYADADLSYDSLNNTLTCTTFNGAATKAAKGILLPMDGISTYEMFFYNPTSIIGGADFYNNPNIQYNSSTQTLTVPQISGNITSASQILVNGTITSANNYLLFSNAFTSGGTSNQTVRAATQLTYSTNTQTLSATNLSSTSLSSNSITCSNTGGTVTINPISSGLDALKIEVPTPGTTLVQTLNIQSSSASSTHKRFSVLLNSGNSGAMNPIVGGVGETIVFSGDNSAGFAASAINYTLWSDTGAGLRIAKDTSNNINTTLQGGIQKLVLDSTLTYIDNKVQTIRISNPNTLATDYFYHTGVGAGTHGYQRLFFGCSASTVSRSFTNAGDAISIGPGAGAGLSLAGTSGNLAIGLSALGNTAAVAGSNNICIGNNTGKVLVATTSNEAYNNILVGVNAGIAMTTGHGNTIVGTTAAGNMTGHSNAVVVGQGSARRNTTGTRNICLGINVAEKSDASNVTTLVAMTGDANILFGYTSGATLTAGSNNIALGERSGTRITTGSRNILLGQNSGMTSVDSPLPLSTMTGNDNICIGQYAGGKIVGQSDNVAIGEESLSSLNTGTSDGSIAIGYQAGKAFNGNNPTLCIGYQAGASCTSQAFIIGNRSGNLMTAGTDNLIIGNDSCNAALGQGNNVIYGNNTFKYGLTADNTLIGNEIGSATAGVSMGPGNTAIGRIVLQGLNNSLGTAGYNTAIGRNTANGITSGYNNLVLGAGVAADLTTGYSNIIIGSGHSSATNYGIVSGNNNIIIGYGTAPVASNTTYEVRIGERNAARFFFQGSLLHCNLILNGGNALINGTTYSVNSSASNQGTIVTFVHPNTASVPIIQLPAPSVSVAGMAIKIRKLNKTSTAGATVTINAVGTPANSFSDIDGTLGTSKTMLITQNNMEFVCLLTNLTPLYSWHLIYQL